MEKYFMKRTTIDWFESARSDLQIIERILDDAHLTHQLAFHAQQAIEKSFKAVIEEYNLGLIKTHSLETLYGKIKNILPEVIHSDHLIILDQLYLDARYPGELGLLPDGKPSLNESHNFYSLALKVFEAAQQACHAGGQ